MWTAQTTRPGRVCWCQVPWWDSRSDAESSVHCWTVLADVSLQYHMEVRDSTCGEADCGGGGFHFQNAVPESVLQLLGYHTGSDQLLNLRLRRNNAVVALAMEEWTGSSSLQHCSFLSEGARRDCSVSHLDSSWAPFYGCFPGTSNWEETLG